MKVEGATEFESSSEHAESERIEAKIIVESFVRFLKIFIDSSVVKLFFVGTILDSAEAFVQYYYFITDDTIFL